MRREVFEGRSGTMTVGECPGVRRDNVLLFTDPARRELDMVFQFDHVDLGLEAGKFHPRPLRPGELADCLSTWQEAQGEVGWNSLYLDITTSRVPSVASATRRGATSRQRPWLPPVQHAAWHALRVPGEDSV